MSVSDGQDGDAAVFNNAFYSRLSADSYSFTDGQAATNVTSQTVDGTLYSALVYDYQVIRGTTVFATGKIVLQYLNSTWRIADGGYAGEDHGLTFTVTQSTTVAQLKIAADSGAGNGTFKFKKVYFPT